jgi:hypothetical protein
MSWPRITPGKHESKEQTEMTRLKVLIGAFAALCAFACVMSASALASGVGPTLLFPEGNGPTVLINLEGKKLTVASELQSTAAHVAGRRLELEVTLLEEKGHLEGKYLAKFYETESTATREACKTAGAEEGEIEVGGRGVSPNIKVVYLNTSGGASLLVGTAFEVPTFTFTCNRGALEVEVKGSTIGTLGPLNTKIAAGANRIEGKLQCPRSGEQEFTRYINNKGEVVEDVLKVNAVGGRAEKGCELVGGSGAVVKLLANKEVELMG